MRVKAPNGLVLDVPGSIASGLVGGRDRLWSYVTEDDQPADPGPADPPKAYASKAEWVKHAIEAHGMEPAEAEGLSKAALIERLK